VKRASRKSRVARTRAKSRGTKKSRRTRRKANVVIRYFRQTWAELKKVHWPNQRQATNLTMIVLTVTVAMSVFLAVIDWLSALFFSLLVDISG